VLLDLRRVIKTLIITPRINLVKRTRIILVLRRLISLYAYRVRTLARV
jgi:hypothetical protein